MRNCPQCGGELANPVKQGLASCLHCRLIFPTSVRNQILAASWVARKKEFGIDQLQFITELPEKQSQFVHKNIIENEMCHDEFLKLLDEEIRNFEND